MGWKGGWRGRVGREQAPHAQVGQATYLTLRDGMRPQPQSQREGVDKGGQSKPPDLFWPAWRGLHGSDQLLDTQLPSQPCPPGALSGRGSLGSHPHPSIWPCMAWGFTSSTYTTYQSPKDGRKEAETVEEQIRDQSEKVERL